MGGAAGCGIGGRRWVAAAGCTAVELGWAPRLRWQWAGSGDGAVPAGHERCRRTVAVKAPEREKEEAQNRAEGAVGPVWYECSFRLGYRVERLR